MQTAAGFRPRQSAASVLPVAHAAALCAGEIFARCWQDRHHRQIISEDGGGGEGWRGLHDEQKSHDSKFGRVIEGQGPAGDHCRARHQC